LSANGEPSGKVARYAYLNAYYETGFNNPIDEAIRSYRAYDVKECRKLAEIPYDFYRKRLSMLISDSGSSVLITKGALTNVLAACSHVENNDGTLTAIDEVREDIEQSYESFSAQGLRTLGVAYKVMDAEKELDKDDETGMRFLGGLTLFDPPKANCAQTIEQLRQLGVTLKIITGDNRLVAESVSQQLGLSGSKILTGPEIAQISGNALMNQVAEVNVFAEVEPNQKEQIIIFPKPPRQLSGDRHTHYCRCYFGLALSTFRIANWLSTASANCAGFIRGHCRSLSRNGRSGKEYILSFRKDLT